MNIISMYLSQSHFIHTQYNHKQLTGLPVKDSVGVPVGLAVVGNGEGAELKLGMKLILGLALGTPDRVTVSTVTLCPTCV